MAAILILSAWAIIGAALCGGGLLAGRVLGIRTEGSLSRSFWLGWACTLGVLCAVCLVHPVDGTIAVLFLAVGAAGFAIPGDERRQWWQRFRGEARWLVALLPVAMWLADRARLEPQNGDSYVYHLHAVAWAESYRATPGLGNLHDRLGFNNSSTLFLALLDHGPLADRAQHFANGLLLLPLFGRGVRAVRRLAGDFRPAKQRATVRDGFDALLLAPAVDWALGMNLSSASPDLPVACLEAAIASELAGGVEADGALAALVLMGAGLLTLKLSALGFVAGLALSVAVLMRRRDRNDQLRRAGIASAVFLIAWLVRGIVLSGYPLYPNPVGALPVDWRVPLERAREQYGYMLGWGRRPDLPWREVLSSWDWLLPWARSLARYPRDVVVPLVSLAALVLVAIVMRGRRPGASRPLFVLFVPPLAALVFWFATSPDMRFAGACFWLLPASGAAYLVSRGVQGTAALALPGAVLALALWPFSTPYNHFGPLKAGFRDPSPPRTRPFVTHSGLTLATPTSGSSCYGTALLCASRPDEAIRLRDPNNVAAGFSVEP